jgi:hypothetical protein
VVKLPCLVIAAIMASACLAQGASCNKQTLRQLAMVDIDPSTDTSDTRSIASVDGDSPKQKRIEAMKKFLADADFESQRDFAIALVNYFLAVSEGRPASLMPAAMIVFGKPVDKIYYRPANLKDPVTQYVVRLKPDQKDELKNLIVYMLKAKNLKTDPKKVVKFLSSRLQSYNQVSLIETGCMTGDPTLARLPASE